MLTRVLKELVYRLQSVDGRFAINVLEGLELRPEVFDECFDLLACYWILDPATAVGRSISDFEWFAHLRNETAGVIKLQLDVVGHLSDQERQEFLILILYRVGQLLSTRGKEFDKNITLLNQLLRSLRDENENDR